MKSRLLLLINSLEGGGAEKILVRLANELPGRLSNWDIYLGLLDDLPDAYSPPHNVKLHRLDSRGSLVRSVFETRSLVKAVKPDVVLSFLTRANCSAVFARRGHAFRCVISERVHTTSHLGAGLGARLQRGIVALLYPRADAVVAVSQGVSDELLQNYKVSGDRLVVIHNPVDIADLQKKAEQVPELALPEDFFVTAGRLVPNKGGDVLLRAFAAHRNKRRRLVMLGEGPERARLEKLAGELGVADRVLMSGYLANPHAIVGRATAYVSTSRSEGFPNALVEAMALGRPAAVTDCQAGPSEILAEMPAGRVTDATHAQWGILTPVDDTQAMTAALDDLDDRHIRAEFATRSFTRANSFSTHSVVEAYVRVLCGTET